MRIAPNEIIFSNPAYFKQVYGAGTSFVKGDYYTMLRFPQDGAWDKLDMLSEKNVDKLRIQKRLTGPVLSTQNILKHEGIIDANVDRWMERLKSLTNQPVDLYHEFELMISDVEPELTFGKPYGAVESGSDGGHSAAMDAMWE